MAQIKFYRVETLPETGEVGSLYFVYKGTSPKFYVCTANGFEQYSDLFSRNFSTSLTDAIANTGDGVVYFTTDTHLIVKDGVIYGTGADLTGYATEQWVENKGYLTEHQDISGKVNTSDFDEYKLDTSTKLNTINTNKQDQSDNTLLTTSKTIVGAINELVSQIGLSAGNLNIDNQTAEQAALDGDLNTIYFTSDTNRIIYQGKIFSKEGYVYDASLNSFSTNTGSALGNASHAEGDLTIATNNAEHAEGKYNKSNTGTISSIGIGTSDTDRKNALEVMTDGNIYVNGLGDYDGTNAADPNSEGKTAKTLQNVLLNKGYFFDDLRKSFTEGYNEWDFFDSGIDAEVVTLSGGTPSNDFKTTTNSLTIGDIIRINENIYKIVEKSNENGSYIYTVDTGPVENGGRIYVLKCGAISLHSHTEGVNTKASGSGSHAEGSGSHAEGSGSHAEGSGSHAEGADSHAEGLGSHAEGSSSHAEGTYSHAEGTYSHAEGYYTHSEGTYSHAEGYYTHSEGTYSHAEGQYTIAENNAEHAEGKYNKSNSGTISSIGIGTDENSRKNAFEVMQNGDTFIYGVGLYDGTNINTQNIKGERLPASIQEVLPKYNKERRSICFHYNDADGSNNYADGYYSFVTGYNNKAHFQQDMLQAGNSFVGGDSNNAYHQNTLVFGKKLFTQWANTFVLGKFNATVSNHDGWGDTVLGIVGDGYEDSNGNVTGRNVLLLQGGDDPALYCRGSFKNSASWINDFGEYFEWLDGNPDNEDRIGYMVQLNGDKIEFAESFEKCIGVISGTTGFVGGVCAFEWHNKFLHDKWGREIIGEDGNPVINPDYNPDLEYIPREQRKEWDVVGLIGQVITRQDGTLEVGGYASCNNGIATNATNGFKVLKIIDNETALLLVK